jgi:hypothetical protein
MIMDSDTKYEIMLKANSTKVSVIGFTRRKARCLNENDVTYPKIRPMDKEIIPSMKNSAIMINGVAALIFVVSRDLTVL